MHETGIVYPAVEDYYGAGHVQFLDKFQKLNTFFETITALSHLPIRAFAISCELPAGLANGLPLYAARYILHNRGRLHMTLHRAIQELHAERAKVDQTIAYFEALRSSGRNSNSRLEVPRSVKRYWAARCAQEAQAGNLNAVQRHV